MEILSVCLSVCPVQFVFTELQSGSHLLLGVPSKPKTAKSCENSVVDPQRIGSGKCEDFRLCVCVCPSHFFAAKPESGSKLMLGVHQIHGNL